MHHIDIIDVAGEAIELLLLGVALVELVGPRPVEVYGVQDVCHCRRIHLVNDGGYHIVGMLTAPSVYSRCALGIVEVKSFHGALITVGDSGCEFLLQLKLIVEGNIVCNVERGLLVGSLCPFHEIGIERVHLVDVEVFGTDGSHNLLSRYSFRSIGKHRHKIGDAHWRDHARANSLNLREKVKGKLVITLHEVILRIREHHEPRVDIVFIRHACHTITLVVTDFLC